MKWDKKNDYYLEHLSNTVSFSISKSIVYGKSIYELWILPYNNAKLIFRSENLNDVKAKAIQYYQEQLTSSSDEAAGLNRKSPNRTLAGDHQGALF